jgi:hypothetical protein
MRYLLIFFFLLSGCTSYQKNTGGLYGYEEINLAPKLYFLKYGDVYLWSTSNAKSSWLRRATELCGNYYDVLAYHDYIEYLVTHTGVSRVNGIPQQNSKSESSSTSEGYILCDKSKLTAAEIEKIINQYDFCWGCQYPALTEL